MLLASNAMRSGGIGIPWTRGHAEMEEQVEDEGWSGTGTRLRKLVRSPVARLPAGVTRVTQGSFLHFPPQARRNSSPWEWPAPGEAGTNSVHPGVIGGREAWPPCRDDEGPSNQSGDRYPGPAFALKPSGRRIGADVPIDSKPGGRPPVRSPVRLKPGHAPSRRRQVARPGSSRLQKTPARSCYAMMVPEPRGK